MSSVEKEKSRYDRQERLAFWDQEIIRKSTVMIVGMGGTGSEVAKNLALVGIGKLIIVDNDTIEFSNLNRQMLFREKDIGKSKAKVSKRRIKNLFNPEVEIEIFSDKVQNIPQKKFDETDIIAGCVDNYLTRQFLNSIAVELSKPYVDSATDGYLGQVRYIKARETACLACDNPPPPDETKVWTEPCTLVGEPRIRDHCAWKAMYNFHNNYNRDPDESRQKDMDILLQYTNDYAKKYNYSPFSRKELIQLILFHVPSIITVNSIISGFQSQLILNILFSIKQSMLKDQDRIVLESLIKSQRFRIPSLIIYSALNNSINSFDLVPDPKCLVCGTTHGHSESFIVLEV
ncbi:MAG: ThiF family adenylyltransferase, partial [Candidatus Heimdallarchaeaceae archaeon]